jgi:hypothetical protein
MAAITFAPMAAQTCAAPSNDATINLGSVLAGRSTFRTHLVTGTTMGYEITDGAYWEEGYGALTHGTPDTLARSTVTRNSAGTTDRIVFPGAATVISFPPSTKTIVLDTTDAAAFPGTVSASNGTTGTNVVNYSQFSAGGTSAYITNKLPGAFRETIGTNEVTTDGSGNASITFPIAFTDHEIQPIVVVSNGNATQSATSVHLIGATNIAFQVVCPGRISDTYTVNWYARGVA